MILRIDNDHVSNSDHTKHKADLQPGPVQREGHAVIHIYIYSYIYIYGYVYV